MTRRALLCGFFFLGLCLVPCQGVHAVNIIADATGYDAGYVRDFWGVQFVSGTGYIVSVTFDLTATGGYFDFDGSPFLNPSVPGVEPIIGATNGLAVGDISYPRADGGPVGHPQVLTFTFSPGSFAAGDWFRFSADVDPISSAGGVFGSLGATFSVTLSTGDTSKVPFVTVSSDRSEAVANVTPVPPPDVSGCIKLKGAPLAGVEVQLKQKGKQTATTGVDGCYQFDSVDAGKKFDIEITVQP